MCLVLPPHNTPLYYPAPAHPPLARVTPYIPEHDQLSPLRPDGDYLCCSGAVLRFDSAYVSVSDFYHNIIFLFSFSVSERAGQLQYQYLFLWF